MATSSEDLEAYLHRLDRRYQRLDDGTCLVSLGAGQPPAAMRVAPPVVVLQVDIGPAPEGEGPDVARLFRRLLELNATDLMHVAYALEDGHIVLVAALELETCDLSELEAVLANFDLALAQHVPDLRQLAGK